METQSKLGLEERIACTEKQVSKCFQHLKSCVVTTFAINLMQIVNFKMWNISNGLKLYNRIILVFIYRTERASILYFIERGALSLSVVDFKPLKENKHSFQRKLLNNN